MNTNSIERIGPLHFHAADATGMVSYRTHIERYRFTNQRCVRASALDIGCGVGYVATIFLSDGGIFATFVPVTPSANLRHVNDFTTLSLKGPLAEAQFEIFDDTLQVQTFSLLSVILPREKRLRDVRRSLIQFYAKAPARLGLRLRSLLIDRCANRYITLGCRKS
jgi:hypothetical protein